MVLDILAAAILLAIWCFFWGAMFYNGNSGKEYLMCAAGVGALTGVVFAIVALMVAGMWAFERIFA